MQRVMLFVLMFFIARTATAQTPNISTLLIKAPETFRAEFKTSKGDFIIEAYRKWSPQGVDRLYQLIKTGFYNNTLLFRVEPDYVVQFGVSNSNELNRFWDTKKLPDEPLQCKNLKGVISYARDGKNDRATQLFINMGNNPKLDTINVKGVKGFTPVAKVIKGMGVVRALNDRYRKKPATIQDSLYKYGNRYFEELFPGLDRIITARIIGNGLFDERFSTGN
jgi:peptidyl-prolyl cis-trans isomerase A (cyclophilin A)